MFWTELINCLFIWGTTSSAALS